MLRAAYGMADKREQDTFGIAGGYLKYLQRASL